MYLQLNASFLVLLQLQNAKFILSLYPSKDIEVAAVLLNIISGCACAVLIVIMIFVLVLISTTCLQD